MKKRLGYEYSNRDDKHKPVSNEVGNATTEKIDEKAPQTAGGIIISTAHHQLIADINAIAGIILSPQFATMSETEKKSCVTSLIVKVQIESELSTTKRMKA